MKALCYFAACLLSFNAILASAQDNPVLVGTVTRVFDGDTIKVDLASGPITVRFASIDAPEKNQPWGTESREALAQLLDGQEVNLEVTTQDRYERLVATVYVGDLQVNAWMVDQGNAWAYRRYLENQDYCSREDQARTQKSGLWSLSVDSWIAPWEWRHGGSAAAAPHTDYRRETAANCINAVGAKTPASSGGPIVTVDESRQCVIKGNISANGHIYHVPGSPNYAATKIDESRGERWFCTEEDAREAGWRSARVIDCLRGCGIESPTRGFSGLDEGNLSHPEKT